MPYFLGTSYIKTERAWTALADFGNRYSVSNTATDYLLVLYLKIFNAGLWAQIHNHNIGLVIYGRTDIHSLCASSKYKEHMNTCDGKWFPGSKRCLCVQACACFLTRLWRQEENSSTRCCAGGNERTASTKVSKWIWKSSISLPVAVSSSPPLIASQTALAALCVCNPPRATPHLLGTFFVRVSLQGVPQ